MINAWTPRDTTTNQDHVIAHVLGATFLGYFVFEEALYVLLDIGFIWTIFWTAKWPCCRIPWR